MMTSSVSSPHQYETRLRTRIESENPPPQDTLHTVGYKVYKSAVKIPSLIVDEAIQRSEKAGSIFNHNERMTRNDRKRRQVTLSSNKSTKRMKQFLESVNSFVSQNVSDVLKPAPWVVIHSKPGCQHQAAHCDYVPDRALETVSNANMPLAVIVPIMPGTQLNVWPHSIGLSTSSTARLKNIKPISCKVEKLDVGDVFVFRGDLVHAGSSYEKDNYRLHTFLDSKEVKRQPNRTWLVHTHGNEDIRAVIIPKG